MKTNIINLYKLNNLSKIDFSYKLISFDVSFLDHDPKEIHKCIEKMKQEIGSNIKGPVASLKIDNKRFIAIPANRNLTISKAQSYSFPVPLQLSDEIHHTSIDNPEHKDIIYRLLDYEIRKHLKDKHQLWSLNTYQLYLTKPVFSNSESEIEMYGGFIYQLIEDNDEYYISINPTYKYLSKNYLSDIVNLSNYQDLVKHIKSQNFLYQNGDDWYQVEVKGFGKPICEHEFKDNQNNAHIVKDYILNKTRNHKFKVGSLLKDDHLALIYTYPHRNMKPHSGATSLAKRIFSTDEKEVQYLHRKAILEPYKRFSYMDKSISNYFQDIDWNGNALSISKNSLEERLDSFPIPELKYNNERVLSVKNIGNNSEGTPLRDFGIERKNWIKQNQIFTKTPFTTQYLIVPDFADPTFIQQFRTQIKQELKNLAPQFPEFDLITYKAKSTGSATENVNKIADELNSKNITSGNALFLLPFDYSVPSKRVKNFHDCLKKKFFPNIKFQCASLSRIKSFYNSYLDADKKIHYKVKPQIINKYKSYLFNLLMELLIVNRKWPYVLNKNLNYDIYIGIDVHDRYAGFCFFYKNGENIFFEHKNIPKTSGDRRNRAEKLKVANIVPVLLNKLEKHIPKYVPNPNGIVIIRDGRSFGQEEKALLEVIERLDEKGLVDKERIKYGVLDLYKNTSVPLRAAVKIENQYNRIDNTISGTYKIISSNGNLNGYIFNTGFPFKIKGTANPIHINLKDGNLDFKLALEDVYVQTMLAFSAPDRPNSLPITIKLIDTYLAPVAASFHDVDIEEVEVGDIDVN